MQEDKKDTKAIERVKEEVDKSIKRIIEQGVQTNNIDFLGKMVDVKKDIAEIEKEEHEMMYRARDSRGYGASRYEEGSNYGNYAGGRQRDSRGRYMEGSYGARYRGHDMLDEMYQGYGEYAENREQYGRGNYGAKGETIKSLEYMLQSAVDFFEMLKREATSQEEVEMIKKYAKKISEM